MSLIESITTLRVEDFPSEKEWIGKLLGPMNTFLLDSTSAINGNIEMGVNVPCQTQTLNFTYGSNSLPIQFKWKLPNKPVELRVAQCTEAGSAIAVVIAWSFANSLVSVESIVKLSDNGASSLTSGSVYNLILRGQP